MDESAARDVISRYVQAISQRDYDAIREIFADDVVVEWPQSGERVVGKEACINIFSNYPGGSPQFVGLRRVMGSGDVWLSEAEMDYPGGERWITVGAFEFRDGKIAHEVDWFAQPFPAPEWRMQWVDQA
jgi:hypothetical protein